MNRKTIAVDSIVYEKLVRLKRKGESFSRVINRLIDRHLRSYTGADILAGFSEAPCQLSASEAAIMERVIQRARNSHPRLPHVR